LGYEFPKDTDEFYEMCVAFRDMDPNGNGKQDELPITFQASGWVGGILYHANPWGIAARGSGNESAYFKVENGTIVPNITKPEFRAFLEYMNMFAKEKLLDVEGFSQTGAQQTSKIEEGVVGMYSGWLPGSDNVHIYKALPPFDAVGYEGQYKHHGEYQKFRGMRCGFVMTSACNDPANLLRWWEFLESDTKMRYTGRYGKEGILWEMRDDGKIYTIYEDGPDGMSREDMKYTYGLVDGGPLILPTEPEINDPEKYPDSIHRQYACDTYLGYYMDEFLPMRFVDPDKNQEKSFMETEINEYMKTFIANSIIDTINDDTWNAHLAQLEALNMDTWLQWYQDFLDGKF
jgi:putative aldouronate transport system substrate-binding protein